MKSLTACLTAVAIIGLGALAPGEGRAQGVQECFTGAAITGNETDGWQPVSELANPDTQCLSAIVTTYRNDPAFVGQTVEKTIQLAYERCNLPNGPYRRATGANTSNGDPDLDYVVIETNTQTGGPNATACAGGGCGSPSPATQIGGTFNPETSTLTIRKAAGIVSGAFTLEDITTIGSGAATDQIIDVPGFEWVLFLKNQGNMATQTAALICDVNMWYNVDATGLHYGLYSFLPNFSPTNITVAYAAGPSGFSRQQNVNTACGLQNPALTITDQEPAASNTSTAQERFTAKLMGAYKGAEAPFNVSSCATPAATIVLEKYCDPTEGVGRPNACNTGGAAAGISGYLQQQAGTNTTCGSSQLKWGFKGTGTYTTSTC